MSDGDWTKDHGLVYNPKTRRWVEKLPTHCPTGHQLLPGQMLVGTIKCRLCGDHRTVRCGHPDHVGEADRTILIPPPMPECREAPRMMGPDGGMSG